MSSNPNNNPVPITGIPEEDGDPLAESSEAPTPRRKHEGISLDDIFEKIGFGTYQTRLTLNMGLVAFAEGAQIIVSTLNLTILQNEWNLSDFQVSLMASLFFLGVLVGSAFAGHFADLHGRYKPIMWALGLMSIFNFVSAFSNDLFTFILFRTLLGFFMGFFAPLGFTMLTENVPIDFRGKIVMIANGFLFMGELFACLLAFFTVGNLVDGNWRLLTMASTAYFIIPFILNSIWLEESIRYNIVMGNFEEAFHSLERIPQINNIDYRFSEDEKLGLIKWQSVLAEEITNEDVASVKALFKPKYKKVTIIIWLGWFNNSFVYYGIVLFFPYILSHISEQSGAISSVAVVNSGDLASLTISTAVESCSVLLAYFIIDSKSIGRKGTMILFYLLSGFASLAAFIDTSRELFIVWVTATKIFIDVCSFYFYLYTIEIYPTKYRATGIGMAAAVGKSGAIFMPWICMLLISIDLLSPFLLFAGMCFIMSGILIGLPMDTKGRELQ